MNYNAPTFQAGKPIFQRSVRIDKDIFSSGVIHSLVPSETFNRTIIEICKQVENGQCAFTWTGSYGSGKSSLAVLLNGLLAHGKSTLYKSSHKLISDAANNALQKTLKNKFKVYFLPIVASRSDVRIQIENLIKQNFAEYEDNQSLLENIQEFSKKCRIIFIIDELGKYLEFCNLSDADIYFLQEVAEIANRSHGHLIFIGILHQAFSTYAESMEKSIRDEWSKIQGRFLDISINISSEEQLNLLRRHLQQFPVNWSTHDKFGYLQAFIKEISSRERWLSYDQIEELYPLNPVSAFLIGTISKRSFSQNQRTLFSFLNSQEPHGFLESIHSSKTRHLNVYSPVNLWDYLYTNLDNTISNSSDRHNWLISCDCVSRAQHLNSEIALNVTKVIALLFVFGQRSILLANIETLLSSLLTSKRKDLLVALNLLVERKIIIYRDVQQVYHLTEASDFELETELEPYLESFQIPVQEYLDGLFEFRPILAKRHYIHSGTFRWMPVKLVSNDEIGNSYRLKPDHADGLLVLSIPFNIKSKSKTLDNLKEAVKSANFPFGAAIPERSKLIINKIKRIDALLRLKSESEAFHIDRIARKEILSGITNTEIDLQTLIGDALLSSNWVFNQYNTRLVQSWQKSDGKEVLKNLNTRISQLFDNFFPHAPQIKNELTNKTKLSANAVFAMKSLVRSCLQNELKQDLGIEKFPPELTIYKAVIAYYGLHIEDKNQEFHFVYPSRTKANTLHRMWKSAEDLFSKDLQSINAGEIWMLWSKPPYGLKRGLFPLLLFLFMLTNRNKLAVYHEDIYVTEFSDALIEWLLKSPEEFSFVLINYDKADKDLKGYAETIASVTQSAVLPLPLEIGRTLKLFLKNQPDWIKGTKILSKTSEQLRDEIKKANDPIDLVFKVIPKQFGSNYAGLKSSLQEIGGLYSKKLKQFRKQIIESFHLSQDSNSIKILNERASLLKGNTGDLKLNPFIVNLERLDVHDESIERILYAIMQKSPKQLIDQDFEHAGIELNWYIERFLVAEAHSNISKRKKYTSSLSVIFGGLDSKPPKNLEVSVNRTHLKKINNLSQKLEHIIDIEHQDSLFGKSNDDRTILVGALTKLLEKKLFKDE